ncbi:uncharacterized protein TRIADDRAFT_35766 [Trichoplax adhaerens]|uniref:Aminopeptidase n=1 Tax=Trichoplax adhaerens TaxID=10228 RepID=B3RU54_TRIAD|nr:hypothetical protein TRIADDRAFT_35766 [Trichoplax adhaerens]EDV25745.1 hypothetical protein TRIADDRAFT_35766 [Trichoplax adhaerens]|eukprot:XP_002111778.1 hypothetical protein TRIADDRAFT_35766 [Trichoplax adhaerens]
MAPTTMAPTTKGATAKPTTAKPISPYAAVNNIRLPKNVIPIQYWFTLEIDMTALTFTGSNVAELNVTSQTDIFIFHIKDMEITTTPQVATDQALQNKLSIKEHKGFKPNDYYYVALNNAVGAGTYYVRFDFKAPLSTVLNGLYKSSYTKPDGTNKWLAASQCQPTDARKIIPLLDEPELKAMFTATISVPNNYGALWNMPELTSVAATRPGYLTKTYQRSLRMSSYLLAFVISDFEFRELRTKTNLPVRVWSTPHTINQSSFALIGGVNITEYFEDFFGVPYPLPKQGMQDSISLTDYESIPDFAAGAMENWGLILYRETALLYDPMVSAAGNQQRVAVVVSHELAHMWFGNLVTMRWWDDLWLNEGFASFTEYLGVNEYQPDWEMMSQIVPLDYQRAFGLDAFVTSHPVQVTVNHPDEINEVFDAISYSKGASIISMMRQMMGNEDYQKGISNYLKKYEFKNAVTRDLWRTLTEASTRNINVTEVMDTWTLQMGYPVVTVGDVSGGKATITQRRFLLDPTQNPDVDPASSKFKSPFGYKWNIPITYITADDRNTVKSTIFKMNSNTQITWPDGTWLKANVGQLGFYRVNYPASNWNAIISALVTNPNEFPKTDISGLIDDAFNLARVGQTTYDIALGTTKYLTKETTYIPWYTATAALGEISSMISYRESYGSFQKYYLQQLKPLLDTIRFEDVGSHTQKLLRTRVMSIGCGLGYKPCLDNATRMFQAFKSNSAANAVPPNLKAVVYRYGIASGDVSDWDFLYEYFYKTNVASEKRTILDALSYSSTPWILNRYLQWSINPAKIRSQDTTIVIDYISANIVGRPLAWDFVRQNWPYLRKTYGGSFFSFGRLIRSTAGRWASEFRLKQVQDFFKANPDVGSGATAVNQSQESIRNRIKWITDNEATVDAWLKKNTN